MPDIHFLIERAAALLRGARSAVALTGAGLSTPSGIPDFRSSHSGLWDHDDPLEVASLETFRYAPERFFDWIRPLAGLMRAAQPNAAHHALARLEAAGVLRALITQNIDRLHSRAGSRAVVELHGSIESATCVRCFAVWHGQPGLDDFVAHGRLPRCAACGGLLKPNVTLMGEQMPLEAINAAYRAARTCDVMLVAGSSLEVMPAGSLPLEAAARGAQVIMVNLQPTHLDAHAAVRIQGDVADVLPRLAQAVIDHSYASP